MSYLVFSKRYQIWALSTHKKNHSRCHLPPRQYFKDSLKMNCCPCLFSTFYRGAYGTGKYWFSSPRSDIVIPDVSPELISVRSSLFHRLSCVFWNTCISVAGVGLMEDDDLLSPDGCRWPSHRLGAINMSSKVPCSTWASAGWQKCTDSVSWSEDIWKLFRMEMQNFECYHI